MMVTQNGKPANWSIFSVGLFIKWMDRVLTAAAVECGFSPKKINTGQKGE